MDIHVYSGQTSTGIVLTGQNMIVSSGGTAIDTTIRNHHVMDVYSGGVATSTTVDVGIMNCSGGHAYYAYVGSDGTLWIESGGLVTYGTLTSGGMATVSDKAQVTSLTLRNSGILRVFSGGTATSSVVSSGGAIYVQSGGSVDNISILNSGLMHIYHGGTATSAFVSKGGSMFVSGRNALTRSATVSSGLLNISAGGTATDTAVSGGSMLVEADGSANVTIVRAGGSMVVSSGAETRDTHVDYNGFMILRGGSADRVYVSNGTMIVSSGRATNVAVSEGGSVSVRRSGEMEKTDVRDGGRVYLSGGTMTSTGVSSGWFDVSCGTVTSTTLGGRYAVMYMSSGATASATKIDAGVLYVSSGASVSQTTVNGGDLNISSGATASVTSVTGSGNMYVHSDGSAVSTYVFSGGSMRVSKGGTAVLATVYNGGEMTVSSSAAAHLVAVANGGAVSVKKNAVVNSAVVGNGGSMSLAAGAKLTGLVTLYYGTELTAAEGSIVDFNLVGVVPYQIARVNDLSKIDGTPDFTITVSAQPMTGKYILAEGATAFDGTITVNDNIGVELGTLGVGEKISRDGYYYSLGKTSDVLSLTISGGTPAIASGDLNGDGRADIVMTIDQSDHPADGSTGAWLIQADQTAVWGDLSQRGEGWEIFGKGFTAADKATADVYVRNGGMIGAWVTDDSGSVTDWYSLDNFDSDTQIIGLGDFNGDGQTDLLLRNDNGAVGCYLTDGTGWNYFQSLGDEWTVSAVGDLNGDGRDDVVLKHDAGFAGSWLTQYDCTMAWANLDTLADGFSIVGCGDFDGDGTDDVLLQNGSYYGAWIVQNGSVSSWMGLGDLGTATVEQIADFDGDGIDDLRIRTAAGDLGSQLVKGADTLQWKYYGSVGSEWSTSLAAI